MLDAGYWILDTGNRFLQRLAELAPRFLRGRVFSFAQSAKFTDICIQKIQYQVSKIRLPEKIEVLMASPTKIKLHKQEYLEIVWDDGKTHNFDLKFLRDESPDAGNKGETILWKHYAPPPKKPLTPQAYEVEKIEMVGNYAIQIKWKDGYDFGIYSWDVLQRLGDYLEVKNNLHQDFEHG